MKSNQVSSKQLKTANDLSQRLVKAQSGGWQNLFEKVQSLSKLVYIDGKKKYAIIQTSYFEELEGKIEKQKGKILDLQKLCTIKDGEIESLKSKNQSFDAENKIVKKTLGKYKKQLINYQEQSKKGMNILQNLKKKILECEQKLRNCSLRTLSVEPIKRDRFSMGSQTGFRQLNYILSEFKCQKTQSVHYQSDAKCNKECQERFGCQLKSLQSLIADFTPFLEDKAQFLSKFKLQIKDYERMKKQNEDLKARIEILQYEGQQRLDSWRNTMMCLLKDAQNSWQQVIRIDQKKTIEFVNEQQIIYKLDSIDEAQNEQNKELMI